MNMKRIVRYIIAGACLGYFVVLIIPEASQITQLLITVPLILGIILLQD